MDDGSKPNIGKRAFQQEPPPNKNPIFEDNESDDLEEEEDSACGGGGEVDADGCKKKRGSFRRGCGGAVVAPPLCQAEKCGADLRDSKRYHRRHKVCEVHAKAPVVLVTGLQQRFCQQCSRFHELSEFDEAKKSCRRRLAGHNERRRKSSSELNGEGSIRRGANPQLKESQCRQADERGRVQIKIPENSTCKHFQIR